MLTCDSPTNVSQDILAKFPRPVFKEVSVEDRIRALALSQAPVTEFKKRSKEAQSYQAHVGAPGKIEPVLPLKY